VLCRKNIKRKQKMLTGGSPSLGGAEGRKEFGDKFGKM
jgi:hypothetical protein